MALGTPFQVFPEISLATGSCSPQSRISNRTFQELQHAKVNQAVRSMSNTDTNQACEFLSTASRVTLNIVCSKCQEMLDQSKTFRSILKGEKRQIIAGQDLETFVLGTRHQIEDSAMSGCHLCALALSVRRDFDIAAFLTKRRQGKRYRDLEDVISLQIRQDRNWHPGTQFTIDCTSDRDLENSDPEKYDPEDEKDSMQLNGRFLTLDEAQHPHVTTMGSSTDAPEVFQLASSWLTACLESHSGHCGGASFWGPVKPMIGFPTRLIHISSDDVKQRLRLMKFGGCEQARSSAGLRYLILSHCWGPVKFKTLTKSNEDKLMQGIAFEELSKTFQDAVLITRRLGFEYLWIDSLCIVQDDLDDWKRAALHMGDYYANAVCTIAALGAEDGSAGCFQSRNPLFFMPATLKLSSGEYFRLGKRGYIEFLHHGRKGSPLHKRAWVIQERLLSKRTLYYGSTGLYWECLQGHASECEPEPPPVAAGEVFALEHVQYNMKRQLWPLARSLALDGISFYQSWSEILKEYTSCELTYQTDKLMAISGITSLIERETHWRCRAGLWENALVPSLLWRRDHYLPGTRINSDTLPTWSWASLNGPVWSFHLRLSMHEKMIEPRLDVKAEIVDDATPGPLQCRLRVRCGILSLTTSKQPSHASETPRRYLDCLVTNTQKQLFADFWPDMEIEEGTIVGVIPMLRWDKEGQSDTYSGLVGSPVKGMKKTFERVGYFERSVRASSSVQHLTALFQSVGLGNPCGPEEPEWWEEEYYNESAKRITITLI